MVLGKVILKCYHPNATAIKKNPIHLKQTMPFQAMTNLARHEGHKDKLEVQGPASECELATECVHHESQYYTKLQELDCGAHPRT